MELGPLVVDFKPPPHPKGISLDGKLVQLVPMEAEEYAEALFEANQLDTEGTNWAYLPYGPFADLKSYHSWVRDCLLYTSPSPRDRTRSRMPSSA